jgi:hypothetical protein
MIQLPLQLVEQAVRISHTSQRLPERSQLAQVCSELGGIRLDLCLTQLVQWNRRQLLEYLTTLAQQLV